MLKKIALSSHDKYVYCCLNLIQINALTPIELPSDEDIEDNAYTDKTVATWEYERQVGFERGAKWMKEQILNQTYNQNK